MSKLADLERALADATDELRQAEERTSEARSAECAAINRVNEAQRAFDTYVKEIRDAAPRSSDWKQRERMREAVPAEEPAQTSTVEEQG